MPRTWTALAALTLVPAIAAITSKAHPALDSLGVALPYAMLAAVPIGLVAGVARLWPALFAALLTLLIGVPLVLPPLMQPEGPPDGTGLRLLQQNLHFRNPAPDLARRMAGYDIVTLQEARHALDSQDLLPGWNVQRCADGPVRLTAVLTRHPVLARGCLSSGTWMRIDTPKGAVTVATLHLYWPWPRGQQAQVARLRPELRALAAPVVLTGDMNQTPWSHTLAQVAEDSGTRPVPGAGATYIHGGGSVRLPIDHVLLPGGWPATATRLPPWRADHHAVELRFAVPDQDHR